jgi:nucleoside-diphosphate-sugar epimerase
MRVVVTGGCGFLGRILSERILSAGTIAGPSGPTAVTELVVVDIAVGPLPDDDRVTFEAGDIRDEGLLDRLLDADAVSIFHLASMVSAESELDWSAAVHANVGGLIQVIEASQRARSVPRLVFASSVAVFGRDAITEPVGDSTKQTATTTYGVTKAIGEMLVDDATRKGFVDGRTARLPTVVVRPGKANRAASSFASGVFREPLQGLVCELPVEPDAGIVVIGASTAVECLLAIHELDGAELGAARAVGMPGLSLTVADMLAALERIGGPEAAALVVSAPDESISTIVTGWPSRWDDRRARQLGLPADADLDSIVIAFAESLASP